jgi:hypothetical protein
MRSRLFGRPSKIVVMPTFTGSYGNSLCALVLPTFSIGRTQRGPRRPTPPPRSPSRIDDDVPGIAGRDSYKIELSRTPASLVLTAGFLMRYYPTPDTHT